MHDQSGDQDECVFLLEEILIWGEEVSQTSFPAVSGEDRACDFLIRAVWWPRSSGRPGTDGLEHARVHLHSPVGPEKGRGQSALYQPLGASCVLQILVSASRGQIPEVTPSPWDMQGGPCEARWGEAPPWASHPGAVTAASAPLPV